MRKETKNAIEGKFEYYLRFKDKKGNSAQHAAKLLKKIGIKKLTPDLLKAYLYGGFSTMCYDITAVMEARGIPRKETLKLWKDFYRNKKQIINSWIDQAKKR